MSYIRSLTLATVLAIALGGCAQTSNATPGQPQSAAAGSMVDQHLHMLSQSLDLTADQQAKIRPILAKFLDARQKVLADASLSDAQRRTRIEAMHEKADRQARKFLNDDQKKKLDELEQQHEQQASRGSEN
jgi:Spy/CpxP family protein refolding chaperone